MAPMQWRDATVGETDATGLDASRRQATRPEPAVRQVFDQVSETNQLVMAGSATPLPIGLDLPCAEEPELFFAESPEDVETAKAMCWGLVVQGFDFAAKLGAPAPRLDQATFRLVLHSRGPAKHPHPA